MAKKAPGKSHRKGLTFLEVVDMFRDEKVAKTWLSEHRWPSGPACIYCGSFNVQSNIKHKSMTHRCRENGCDGKRKMFSIKMGTVMEGSKLKYRAWAVGIYLFTTNIKEISSMKLHKELGIGQKAAWFMLHRLRKAFEVRNPVFLGPVEVDEIYNGGKEKNKNGKKKRRTQRGAVGKSAVAGAKDRASNRVSAKVIASTAARTLQGFVVDCTAQDATVYTDEHKDYTGIPRTHKTVKHSRSEYVNGMTHTNGIKSFWSMFKRGYHGTFHHFSEKHTRRYVAEFAGRHNIREQDTIEQMQWIIMGMVSKRLRYRELVTCNMRTGCVKGGRA